MVVYVIGFHFGRNFKRLTGDNYEKIIDSLKSRFDREDLQIEVYVRELLKLVLNNVMSKGKKDMSRLYDDIETQLRALEILSIRTIMPRCCFRSLNRVNLRSYYGYGNGVRVIYALR